jgi:hypothetical protein
MPTLRAAAYLLNGLLLAIAIAYREDMMTENVIAFVVVAAAPIINALAIALLSRKPAKATSGID